MSRVRSAFKTHWGNGAACTSPLYRLLDFKRNKQQQQRRSTSPRHQPSLTLTTVALQHIVGFLLNTFSQLPIIRSHKTTADCIGRLFNPTINPISFASEKRVSAKCIAEISGRESRRRQGEERKGNLMK